MPEDILAEFACGAAAVQEALQAAEAALDRLDFSCSSWMAGRILTGIADHIANIQKLLARLLAGETAG